eukprot:TRINITY_DN6558_c0_g1_i2.p1 TRINITY_DN6558_c0_g1~~TRINITY_DN6558_c0_g1_i2.p1  ORF type:complete len:117 (+),score=8.97 TRINITY_DN6558_c0_g1_i2:178-528(+)
MGIHNQIVQQGTEFRTRPFLALACAPSSCYLLQSCRVFLHTTSTNGKSSTKLAVERKHTIFFFNPHVDEMASSLAVWHSKIVRGKNQVTQSLQASNWNTFVFTIYSLKKGIQHIFE